MIYYNWYKSHQLSPKIVKFINIYTKNYTKTSVRTLDIAISAQYCFQVGDNRCSRVNMLLNDNKYKYMIHIASFSSADILHHQLVFGL